MSQPESLKEAFELAWLRTSTDQIAKEAAMNWFFEGVGAQKQMQPNVRLADAYQFAQLRNHGAPGYRVGSGTSRQHRFFYDFVRRYNDDRKVTLTPTESEVEYAVTQLIKMESRGLKLDDWFVTNYLANRTSRHFDYPGFRMFNELMDSLYHRALK